IRVSFPCLYSSYINIGSDLFKLALESEGQENTEEIDFFQRMQ
ncbi:unnamed protein product, partial [Allacma fusca]